MRIGLVTGEYPPMEGGVGAFTHQLALALRDMEQQVHVFTRKGGEQSREPGITVCPHVAGRWGWATLSQLRHWVNDNRLDIVNIQFQTAAYDMHLSIHWSPRGLSSSGIPVVTTFHDLRVPYLFPKAGNLRSWMVRLLAKSSDGVVATDHQDETRLRHDWHIDRVRWIPIGSNVAPIPARSVDRDEVRHRLGVTGDQLLIAYFGFLNETKGALTLVEALGHLVAEGADACVVMIGGRAGASDLTNQAYGQKVDAAIERSGLSRRVFWSGFVDDAAVSAHFYASDLTVLPYTDGASLRRGTLMAALAHGRAIVTTTPVSSELEGVVLAVPPGDALALSKAIREVWQDPDRRATLERASAAASQQFSWQSIARDTLSFFSEFADL